MGSSIASLPPCGTVAMSALPSVVITASPRPGLPSSVHRADVGLLPSTQAVQVTVRSSPSCLSPDMASTVYISKVKNKGRPAVYRLSLNASTPAPWQAVAPGDGEVPSFQVSSGCRQVSRCRRHCCH